MTKNKRRTRLFKPFTNNSSIIDYFHTLGVQVNILVQRMFHNWQILGQTWSRNRAIL